MRLEQVVAAKGHKSALFLANASLDERLDSSGEIVVTEPVRHSAEKREGVYMPQAERLLLLRREGHHN